MIEFPLSYMAEAQRMRITSWNLPSTQLLSHTPGTVYAETLVNLPGFEAFVLDAGLKPGLFVPRARCGWDVGRLRLHCSLFVHSPLWLCHNCHNLPSGQVWLGYETLQGLLIHTPMVDTVWLCHNLPQVSQHSN